ncbi:MAG: PD40 domain-containing protein, partial [Acidobacteriota bacterium]
AHLMRWVAALAAVSVVVGLGLWWGGWFSSRPLPEFRPTQVTHSSAWEGQPALSPDGGRIAYTSNEAGNSDIFLIDVRGGYPQNLTSSEARDRDPAWFPDGSALAFSSDRGGQTGIWKVGQLGGDPVLLIPAGAQPAISPDGEKIAFVRPDQEGTYRVAVASLENPADSILLTSSGDGFWDHFEPAWSPDGRWICYSARHNLWIVPREGGPAHRLTSQNEHDFSPIWSPDGEFIYFASEREGIQALWRIPSSGGLAERVTVGTGQEGHPDISQSALKMVYSTGAPDRSLLLYNRDSGNETVLSEISDDWMASINRDASQVVYVSSRWGAELNLALQDLRGGHPEKTPRRLGAQEGIPSHPRFSNDGRWVAYYQIIGEERDIYVIGIEEGLPRRFTETPSTEMHPDWSPDDSQVVFVSDRGGRPSVWINSIENGLPVGSSRPLDVGEVDLAYAPVWIADGSAVAFVGRDTEGSEVWLVETEEGARARRLTSGAEAMRVRYDARTGGLLVSGLWGEDNLSVRSVSLTTGEALPLNPPLVLGKTGDLPLFDASSDGEILLFTRENRRGDIWLIESTNGVF